MYKHGLVLGRFCPFHLGHKYLIDKALEQSDNVTLLVCTLEREPIDGNLRYGWIKKTYLGNKKLNIVHITEELPQEPKHENDYDFWDIWTNLIIRECPNINVVFTSESYGDDIKYYMADIQGVDIEHICVNKARTIVPVSGTKIRENPFANWEYIPDIVKPYYTKNIAIVGAESSGKTTLVKDLAEHFNVPYLREYGREYTEYEVGMTELTQQDFTHIAIIHNIFLKSAIRHNIDKYLFIDTEAIVTKIFLQMYSKKHSWNSDYTLIQRVIQEQINEIDLYLLLYPDLEWEDDGSRQPEDAVYRLDNFNKIETELINHSVNYVIIKGGNRLEQAIKTVNENRYER